MLLNQSLSVPIQPEPSAASFSAMPPTSVMYLPYLLSTIVGVVSTVASAATIQVIIVESALSSTSVLTSSPVQAGVLPFIFSVKVVFSTTTCTVPLLSSANVAGIMLKSIASASSRESSFAHFWREPLHLAIRSVILS